MAYYDAGYHADVASGGQVMIKGVPTSRHFPAKMAVKKVGRESELELSKIARFSRFKRLIIDPLTRGLPRASCIHFWHQNVINNPKTILNLEFVVRIFPFLHTDSQFLALYYQFLKFISLKEQ